MSDILFVTDQWGYGTATVALAIAEELRAAGARERDLSLTLAGTGAGFYLAARASLDCMVRTDTMTDRPSRSLLEAVRATDVVVSVMNRRMVRLASDHGKRCVYVDTLFWMWQKPPITEAIERCFVEWFPGAEQHVHEWSPALRSPHDVVGPITTPLRERPPAPRGVLVNFGGLSSWIVPRDTMAAYAAAMIDCIGDAVRCGDEPVRVCVGRHIEADVRAALTREMPDEVEVVDLDHRAYLAALDASRVLVTSPGLGALYESLGRGIPCVLLPSQSLSQLLAVRTLRQRGATTALDWDGLLGLRDVPVDREPEACSLIGGCIDRFRDDRVKRAELVEHLRQALGDPALTRLAESQARFRDDMPPRGTPQVARHLMEMLDACPSRRG